jgi:hypothetical protein
MSGCKFLIYGTSYAGASPHTYYSTDHWDNHWKPCPSLFVALRLKKGFNLQRNAKRDIITTSTTSLHLSKMTVVRKHLQMLLHDTVWP